MLTRRRAPRQGKGNKVDMMAGTRRGYKVDMMAGTETGTQGGHDSGHQDRENKIDIMESTKTQGTRRT